MPAVGSLATRPRHFTSTEGAGIQGQDWRQAWTGIHRPSTAGSTPYRGIEYTRSSSLRLNISIRSVQCRKLYLTLNREFNSYSDRAELEVGGWEDNEVRGRRKGGWKLQDFVERVESHNFKMPYNSKRDYLKQIGREDWDFRATTRTVENNVAITVVAVLCLYILYCYTKYHSLIWFDQSLR